MPLADTLLRMAEAPRLYLPKWSHMVMDEATQNLIDKWSMEPEKARRREEELRFEASLDRTASTHSPSRDCKGANVPKT